MQIHWPGQRIGSHCVANDQRHTQNSGLHIYAHHGSTKNNMLGTTGPLSVGTQEPSLLHVRVTLLEAQRSPLWGFASGPEGECLGSAGEHQGISLRWHSPWAERRGNSQVCTNRGGMNRSATLCLCTVTVKEQCKYLMASLHS